jgi:hypothetical protein
MSDDASAEESVDSARSIARGTRGCMAAAVAVLGLTIMQWVLADWLTPFVVPFAWLAAGLVFAVCAVWAAIQAMISRGRTWKPGAICVVTILLWGFAPFTWWWVRLEYWSHHDARERIVASVQDGSLAPNGDPGVIALGDNWPTVSRGGNDLFIERQSEGTYILFFTFRGILDNYAGFLWVPAGGAPRRFRDLGESARTEIVPLEGRWFWVSHH